MNNIGRIISVAMRLIDGFTRPSEAIIRQMNTTANQALKMGKSIQNAGKVISNAGATFTKSITLPIVAVGVAALKTSNDFGNAMAKVSTIADTTAVPINVLRGQILDLSNNMGIAVTELAEAQYQAISAGVKTADSADFVATAAKAAKGGFTDTTTAVNGLTTVLNSYCYTADKATEISDQMLIAQNFGKTTFGDMASTMGGVIPIASNLNVSTEELFSSVAVLTKNGIATSEAMTGLKAAYSNILKPSAAARKEAEKLKLDFSAAHLKSVGWAKFLEEIKEKSNGNANSLANLFRSTEALNSMMVLSGKGSADFAAALEQIGNSTGATQAAYEKMLTPTEKMNISINKVKNSLIQFGVALTPVFNKVAEVIGIVGDKLNSLSEGQVKAIVKFAMISASIGPAILVFGKLVTAVGSGIKMFGMVTKTIAKFGGIAGLITSPAGIVIGILAAISVAAFLIIKNWDKVNAFLLKVGTWFKNVFVNAGLEVESFQSKFNSIGNTIVGISDKITGFCKLIANAFIKDFSGSIKSSLPIINNTLQTIVGGMAGAFDKITATVDKGLMVFSALLDFFGGAFQGGWNVAVVNFKESLKNIFPSDIANGLIKAFDKSLPIIMAAVTGIKSCISGMVEDAKKIVNNFKTVIVGIGGFFKGIFAGDIATALWGFKTACNGVLEGIGNMFKTKINAIKNFIVGAVSTFLPPSVVKGIAVAFDIIASKWDLAIGAAKGLVEGFVRAIKPLFDNLITILKGVSQFIKGVFTGDWKGALNGLKTIASGALSGLVNIIKAPFAMIANVIKGTVNSFKNLNVVKTIFNGIGNVIKKVLTSCGVDMVKFSSNVTNIKSRVGNIINNMKTIFGVVFNEIGKVVKSVATVIANVFGVEISNTCSTVGAVIIALKTTFGTAFNAIGTVIKTVMGVVVPIVKVAFSSIVGAISSAVHNIGGFISGIMTIFDGITTFIAGVFTGNWGKAWEGIKSIFEGIFSSLISLCKMPINAVIGLVNGAIKGINSLGLTIPDWVPIIGGKAFSINVPTIPMLYKGTNNWAGGIAAIHDRGAEIVDLPSGSRVYPHDKSLEMARSEGAKTTSKGAINITINKLADKIEVRNDSDIDKIVELLSKRLLKVALNTGGM